jgi:acetyl-CoA synthetase
VKSAWGLTIRDGFGQTETTALIGNPPGQAVKSGSMGRPLPGYQIDLVDAEDRIGDEGEICVNTSGARGGLMQGYAADPTKTAEAVRGDHYHTGDVAVRDADGYILFVGRTDDVFKASDYRVSPFELESVLIEHPAVAEAAVVPSPDTVRHAVPKAFVTLVAGREPSFRKRYQARSGGLNCDAWRLSAVRRASARRSNSGKTNSRPWLRSAAPLIRHQRSGGV